MRLRKYSETSFLAGSALGIFLEYLDFILYAHVSVIFARLFFPTQHELLSMLCAWVPFLIGFLFRPAGSLLFGVVGDKFGYRIALVSSMVLMSFSTAAIGILPTFYQAGAIAPILLILLRILQGVAVSPEYNGIGNYLNLGSKDTTHYYLKCSITTVMSGLGILAGGFLISRFTHGYEINAMPEWCWRLPFILAGLSVGLAGVFLRANMTEAIPKKKAKNPIKSAWQKNKYSGMQSIMISGFLGVVTYSLFGYLATSLQKHRGYTISDALSVISYTSIVVATVPAFSGWLADKVGCIKVLLFSTVVIVFSSLLAYVSIALWPHNAIVMNVLLFGFGLSLFAGVVPGFLSKLFSEEHRYTGSCFSYNLGSSIFGGATPLALTALAAYDMLLPAVVIPVFSIAIFFVLFLHLHFSNKIIAYTPGNLATNNGG